MSAISQALLKRPRRLRQNPKIRQLVREHSLLAQDVIMPLFIKTGRGGRQAIASMPGQFQYSLDVLPQVAESFAEQGVQSVLLFGVVDGSCTGGNGGGRAAGKGTLWVLGSCLSRARLVSRSRSSGRRRCDRSGVSVAGLLSAATSLRTFSAAAA